MSHDPYAAADQYSDAHSYYRNGQSAGAGTHPEADPYSAAHVPAPPVQTAQMSQPTPQSHEPMIHGYEPSAQPQSGAYPHQWPQGTASASYPSATEPQAPHQQAPQLPPPGHEFPTAVAPAAGGGSESNVAGAISLLFDVGLTRVATPGLAKLLYIGTLVGGGLWWLGSVVSSFVVALGSTYMTASGIISAVATLLVGWIFPLLVAGLVRVFLEFAMSALETKRLLAESANTSRFSGSPS